MAVISDEIFKCIETIAPLNLAENWDNVGLQVGSYCQKVRRVLLTLDITPAVIQEAINIKANLIISHHPLIFGGIKKINYDSIVGKSITQLIAHNITVYSAHTNLDVAQGGLNDFVSKKIGL